MKRDAPDPILALLMKKDPDAPDDADADQDQSDREDPSLVAGGELIAAVKRGDAHGVVDAVSVLIEALTSAPDGGKSGQGYALGGSVRPRLPRLPGARR